MGVIDLERVKRSSGRAVADLLARAVELVLLREPDDAAAAFALGLGVDDVRAWRVALHGGPLALDLAPVIDAPASLRWNGSRWVSK